MPNVSNYGGKTPRKESWNQAETVNKDIVAHTLLNPECALGVCANIRGICMA